MNLMQANTQWRTRPDDERYIDLGSLYDAVRARKVASWTTSYEAKRLRVVEDQGNLKLDVYDRTKGGNRLLTPSNWSFGQLSQYAGAPASYLRKLPVQLAAINAQWGLEHFPLRDDMLILAQHPLNGGEDESLRAITGPTYGRIWDEEVVRAVQKVNERGNWVVPAASYQSHNPKRATTLYASDRDVFIFLVDPSHPIEVKGETLFRGFMAWNSETGSAVFGLMTFLYRFVCDNRIVWGATDVKELRIRHTGGAPERFGYEGARYLQRYAEESTGSVIHQIEAAQAFEIPKAQEKEGVENWLKDRGFTSSVAKSAVAAANQEEGESHTLWSIIQGVTAHARSITHTDERVALERQAGKLMDWVSNN